MDDKTYTHDELLVLFRDVFLEINALRNKLMTVFFANLDGIVVATTNAEINKNKKE